jgi:hypothetical protein
LYTACYTQILQEFGYPKTIREGGNFPTKDFSGDLLGGLQGFSMKNFSIPRLALVLWFLNYSIYALFGSFWGGIMIVKFVLLASVFLVVELICLGLIEDKL